PRAFCSWRLDILTGPASSLFALAPREAPPVLAPRRFRRTRLAERDGNGLTAALNLAAATAAAALELAMLELVRDAPGGLPLSRVDLAMRYLTCFSMAER